VKTSGNGYRQDMSEERSYIDENTRERERLRALVDLTRCAY
jgi:hypothetical protein